MTALGLGRLVMLLLWFRFSVSCAAFQIDSCGTASAFLGQFVRIAPGHGFKVGIECHQLCTHSGLDVTVIGAAVGATR